MQLDRLPDRLSQRVDRVRDRTAEAMGSDRGSALREISRMSRKLDDIESHLAHQLDTIAELTRDTEDRVDDLARGAGTTWPRRLFWITVGMAAGAAAAYFADPDRGDQRRHEVAGQAQQRMHAMTDEFSERARTVKDEVMERAQDVKGQAMASSRSVADEARDAGRDVADEAQRAVVDVRDEAQRAAEDVKQEASSSPGSPGRVEPPPGRSV